MREYQVCTKCIMDTSDPEITFDDQGVCNHCREFEIVIQNRWFPGEAGREKLNQIVQEIKLYGEGKEYDSIIGLSGGVDSSYLAFKAVELGLRPLAVHVDAGWNSELAVQNIQNICNKLNIDLVTIVVNWEEMRDIQLSFFKAGVPNQDIPQDHAFFASLYTYAVKKGIKYVLNGSNFATEGILPKSWGYNNMDSKHIKAIHKIFGTQPIKEFPLVSFFDYYFYYPRIKKMKVACLLNYMDYSKEKAIKELEEKFGWKYYGGKHFESRFTKFFQSYYLPERFGYDKRLAHLSSLIVSGLLTREEALKEMEKPSYNQSEINEDKEFIAKKLKITVEELNRLLVAPLKSHYDYPNNYKFRMRIMKILKLIARLRQ